MRSAWRASPDSNGPSRKISPSAHRSCKRHRCHASSNTGPVIVMNEPFRLPQGPASAVLEPPEPPNDPTFVREAHRLALFYVRFVRRHRLVLLGVPAVAA